MSIPPDDRGQWTSKLGFVLAAAGSAIGLGNIWRFPYLTGENGGGAFVLIYVACVVLMGVPIMMAEIMLGRRGRQSPVNTMRTLADEEGRSPAWQSLGWLGMIAGFLILSFYSVVGGWTLAYVVRTASGLFTGATADGVLAIFNGFVADPERLLAWHTLFMVMTTMVVARGVKSGLEQAVRFMMPALFLLLVAMAGYAMNTGAYGQAIAYLFTADFSKVTGTVVLSAMGQAFFSLSLGMGAIMIYGSYLSHTASILRMSFIIAGLDTIVALLAGLAIFPLIFAYGLQPQGGPGLIFMTLPIAFGQMPAGAVFGTAFFVLLLFAAWTSAISLLEPIVAWLVENKGISRVKASTTAGIAIWLFGIGSVLSFNLWSDRKLLGKTFFDMTDYVTSNVMLPLGGLLIAVFSVWMMSAESSRSELGLRDGIAYRTWRFLVRYIAPVAIVLVFIQVTGILSAFTG